MWKREGKSFTPADSERHCWRRGLVARRGREAVAAEGVRHSDLALQREGKTDEDFDQV